MEPRFIAPIHHARAAHNLLGSGIVARKAKTGLTLATVVLSAVLAAAAQMGPAGMMLDRGSTSSSQVQESISTNALSAPSKAQEAVQHAREALIQGRDAEAAKQVERALKAYPKYGVAFLLRGLVKARGGQVEEASVDLQQAIAHDPELGAAYAALGSLYNVVGRFSDAAPLLDRATAILPTAWLVHYESAIAYLETGKIEEARQSISRALNTLPNDPYRRSATFYMNGRVLLQFSKHSEAKAAFARSITEDPLSDAARMAQKCLDRLEHNAELSEALPK